MSPDKVILTKKMLKSLSYKLKIASFRRIFTKAIRSEGISSEIYL
ncbi:hypothetical protein HMPREF1548_00404 [Clostridium sp. KLE 1755]|nr:hypothetical protein HMPREF1548_00404 [Clostridium sp. KLE 1755]